MQTEVICRVRQRWEAQELGPPLVLPACPLRGLLHTFVVLPEAEEIYLYHKKLTVLKTRELGHTGKQLLFLLPSSWERDGDQIV